MGRDDPVDARAKAQDLFPLCMREDDQARVRKRSAKILNQRQTKDDVANAAPMEQ